MKDLLKFLPQILGFIPDLMKNLKGIVILFFVLGILGGLGYLGYIFVINYKDPYKCVSNQLYKQVSMDSDVYLFVGDYCVDGKSE